MASALSRLLLLLLVAALVTPASAAYPERPIRMLVTVPPGGAPDIAGRVVGDRLAALLGQPVVIDNRAGSNGNIAGEIVAHAPKDGYTLLLGQDALITINPHLYKGLSFDPLTDLVPVGSVAENQFVLTVNPKLPVRTLAEFIAYAREAREPLPYASAGPGSQHQLAMELLKQRAGIDLLHVPFKGGSPATTATVAGDTVAMFAGTSNAGAIKSGSLRALAVTGARRARAYPDLPTIGETYPGYELTIWLGLFAPAGTPAPVIARLREALGRALADPAVAARLQTAGGLEPMATTPEAFESLIRRDDEKYSKLVRELQLRVD